MHRGLTGRLTVIARPTGTVFIHQDLTYKDSPRTERIKIFLMATDP